MEKYNEYKDSGIEWLGEIPYNWEAIRIDWVNSIVRGNTGLKKDELLNKGDYVALQYGKTYKVDEINNAFNFYVNSELYKKSQVVNYGNTILISTSETIEDLGHSCFYNREDLGLLGGEQILLKPDNKHLIEKYLYYYSKFFCLELRKYATGLKVFRFNNDDLKNIFILIPSIEEQTQIANYLDAKTTAIDKKVKLLQQKIKHYKAYRKTLINETVTKGLDKTVKLKDSGINWIGEIPEHWESFRFIDNVYLRHGYQFRDFDFTDEGIKIVKISQLNPNGNLDLSNSSFINARRLKYFNTIRVYQDDILMALTGGTIGKIIRVGKIEEPILQNYRVGNFFPNKKKINKTFLYFLLASQIAIEQINYLLNRNGQPNIGKESFKNMFFTLPPLKEQQQIANYLDAKTTSIDKVVKNIETQIATLKELRKALINEVVTGKVKVSG